MAKLAVATIAYNEAEYIRACIKNWEGLVDKHLVLVTKKPWNGNPVEDDGTYRIAKESGAETILGEWKTEAEQRSWGLARLYDYDYVLIVDADELYLKEDQLKIIKALNNPIDPSYTPAERLPAFRCARMVTYWKTPEYILDPPDNHLPMIAVDPKQLYAFQHRNFKFMSNKREFVSYAPIIDVPCHHMSWAKSDAKVKEKIESFSHADSIRKSWYQNIWLNWKPGDETLVRAYGEEPSKAIYKPAPQEILDLIEKT